MPGATKKEKKGHGGKSVEITLERPKLVADSAKLGPSSVEKQDETQWFNPSVKGIDRNRPQPAPAASKRVPIIILYGVNKIVQKLIPLMAEKIAKGDFLFEMRCERIALCIKNISDFIWAVNLLDKLGIQYHYKNCLEDKCKRYVLRGIPVSNEADISNAFKARGFTVHDVHRVLGSKSTSSAPVFVFYHTPLPEGPEITGVKRLAKWMVKIESYKSTKKEPMMCLRCCRYNHTATFCSVNPRCFKCAEGHEGSVCRKTSSFKCCNCDGSHPAVAKCCPMYVRVKEYNMSARPKPPPPGVIIGTGPPLGLVSCGPPKFASKKKVPKKKKPPPSRLPKLIARSFVVVAWNARGADVGSCPEFFKFLESQGAHAACVSDWQKAPKGDDKWAVVGTASAGLLVRADVPHERLQLQQQQRGPAATVARVQTKTGIGVRLAVAHVGPNESFAPDEMLAALTQGPGDQATEPTVVFGDFSARHHAWNALVNNRRGKALNRAVQACQASIYGPQNPGRYYREDEAPFVVVAKNLPVTPSILPKRMQKEGEGGSSSLKDAPGTYCPLVTHLRNWRRPKASTRVELPAEVKELIREKNRVRHRWQRTRFSLFKVELDKKRAQVKAKLDALRRNPVNKGASAK